MARNVRRVLVTGSREWSDRHTLYAALREFHSLKPKTQLVVVHGDCPTGADRMAKDWVNGMKAGKIEVEEEAHPADWSTHGRAAGPIRNKLMVDLGGYEAVFAFPLGASTGTRGCMELARVAGYGDVLKVFAPREAAA